MSFDLVLYFANTFLLAYLAWRLMRLTRIKSRDRRFFFGFWFTPLLWFLYENTVPLWAVSNWLFQGSRILLLLVFSIDFFYYYGLRTKTALTQQLLSALPLIPCLLVFGDFFPAESLILTPPYYGRALIWTDQIVNPRTFYFMDPSSKRVREDVAAYADPNYGKAAFSPLDGKVIQVNEGFITVRSGETTARLGPLLAGSVRLQPGDLVRGNQPLGLLAASVSVPGLCLTVEGNRPVRFSETFTGRWWAGRYEKATLKRNQIALADAKDRFQLRPVDQ